MPRKLFYQSEHKDREVTHFMTKRMSFVTIFKNTPVMFFFALSDVHSLNKFWREILRCLFFSCVNSSNACG